MHFSFPALRKNKNNLKNFFYVSLMRVEMFSEGIGALKLAIQYKSSNLLTCRKSAVDLSN